MTDNTSLRATDNRSIQRIVFEKANFGNFPMYFRIAGDKRWHPIQWTKHPELTDVMFSDNSIAHVDERPSTAIDSTGIRGVFGNKQAADSEVPFDGAQVKFSYAAESDIEDLADDAAADIVSTAAKAFDSEYDEPTAYDTDAADKIGLERIAKTFAPVDKSTKDK